MRRHVVGEATSIDFGYAARAPYTLSVGGKEPRADMVITEQPFSDRGELVENIDQGRDVPVPTVQQRQFSAPYSEWDATR